MPDFGIGEAIAAIVSALSAGAGEAAAGAGLGALGAGAGEAAAGAGLGALGTGALEAGTIALPEIAVEAAAPAAAFGAGDAAAGIGLGAGLGGAAAGAADFLGPSTAAASDLSPNAIVGGEFDALNAGIASGDVQPTGGTTPNSFAAPDTITPKPIPTTTISPSAPTPGGAGGAAGLAPSASADLGTAPTFGPDSSLAPPGAGIAGTDPSKTGIGGLISKLGSNAAEGLTKPGNLLAGALAIPALSQLVNPPKIPQSDQLKALSAGAGQFAANQTTLGNTLTSPLTTGKLPAGAEQSVTNAINDAITTTKAKYANLGLSGSTAEADAIANIQNQATAIRFNIAEQMAQTGLSATSQAASTFGLQDQIYSQLMQAQLTQDTALQQALAKFAAAAAGGGGINLKVA